MTKDNLFMWVFYLPYLISIKKISIFFKRRVSLLLFFFLPLTIYNHKFLMQENICSFTTMFFGQKEIMFARGGFGIEGERVTQEAILSFLFCESLCKSLSQ